VRCSRRDSGTCARRHEVRHRTRVTDLSNGEVFERIPIVRVIFCDGTTASLTPAELWRGRTTVSSVLEAVARARRDGIGPTLGWTGHAWGGEEAISERTLRRWRDVVRDRLIGSAMSWLGPRLGLHWSTSDDEADSLWRLLDCLTLETEPLVEFRAIFGRAVLDTVQSPCARPRRPTRRVRGRLDPAPPPNPPTKVLPRGSSSRRGGREPPTRTLSMEERG